MATCTLYTSASTLVPVTKTSSTYYDNCRRESNRSPADPVRRRVSSPYPATSPTWRKIPAMNFFQRFTFLFSAPVFDTEDLEGMRVQQIITAIERMGFQVVKARRLEDAE